ncbi:MAG: nucleotidyl transferase AbiEii/AbiGii toxin family protein [Bacilli bacterium]|nr:nucleotidyl transferase AbiEii/AbiGii toxin family protein [Bacilli bacterium]
MNSIKELVNSYIQKGYSFRNAQNLAAEEIVLKKIATSDLSENVTLKGGIVMFNLSKNQRRVTQDIDFDLIRYSIDEQSIRLFMKKMNAVNDYFKIDIVGEMEKLHQEDYQGVRVNTIISDSNNDKIKLKFDIGVHTYTGIEQIKTVFKFETSDTCLSIKVNPPEQIVSEKLISLARLGSVSTRYKDLYDLYYLIKETRVSPKKVGDNLLLFLDNSKKKPNTLLELENSIFETLNNQSFIKEASKPASKWIDIDINIVKDSIIEFLGRI